MNKYLLILLTIMVISFGVLVLGFKWWRNDVSGLRTAGVEVKAETVGAIISKQGIITYSLRFTDLNGTTHDVSFRDSRTYHQGLTSMKYSPMQIVYNPHNPDFFVAKGEQDSFILPTGWQFLLMMLGAAGSFGLVGMLLWGYKTDS